MLLNKKGATVQVTSILFRAGGSSEGEALTVEPKRVTVFIGPNNGGKSRALIEILQKIAPSGHAEDLIFSRVETSDISEEEFEEKLSCLQRPKKAGEDANPNVMPLEGRGGRQLVDIPTLKSGLKPGAKANVRQYAGQNFIRHFCLNLGGSNRLQLANSAPAEPITGNPSSTIGALFKDDALRSRLSAIVNRAFEQFFVIDPTQMPDLTPRLSTEEPPAGVEKQLSAEAAQFFENCLPVKDASDGTKAFIGILSEVLAGDPDVLIIDEPEAFLHPSLSYLLGQQIASNAREGKQVFAATHSASFLLGCVLSGADVDVIRLTYRSASATARHLPADRLKRLMTDPLFRSVGAVSALFFENAIVVEGDSDRAFYDEVNNRALRYSDGGIRHATFLNAHNKQTVVNIVRPLRDIGIPAAFIFDLDWIKEDGQVWDRYFSALGAPLGLKGSMAAARREVRRALEAADPNYKRKGGLAVLCGEDRTTADAFFDQMEEYGLFTVRSGELECWLPQLAVERTKSKWLPSIFEAMGSDPADPSYLKPGADDVWAFLNRVQAWSINAARRGMGSPGASAKTPSAPNGGLPMPA